MVMVPGAGKYVCMPFVVVVVDTKKSVQNLRMYVRLGEIFSPYFIYVHISKKASSNI